MDQMDPQLESKSRYRDSSSHSNTAKAQHDRAVSVLSSQIMPQFVEIQSDEGEAEIFKQMSKDSGCKYKKYKKEKSLGILCQQFIHLFVTWKKVISLEEAAKKISNCEPLEQ